MNGQRLRPLGLGDIFDEGFDLYKRNFVFLLLVAALTVVPLDILIAFITPRLLPQIFDLLGITSTDAFWVWLVGGLAKLMLFLPLFLLAVAPLIGAGARCYLEQNVTLGQIYGPWLRRLPTLLASVVLTGLALNVSLVLCFVPWLFAAPMLFFTLQAFVVEAQGPVQSLRRSARLAGGYGGRIFGCFLLLAAIAWIIGLGVSFPLAYLVDTALNIASGARNFAGAGRSAEQQIVTLISGGLTHLALLPFLVCVVTVLYYDVRIRKEGYDIEMLADELHYPPLTALGAHLPPVAAYVPVRPRIVPSNPPRPGAR